MKESSRTLETSFTNSEIGVTNLKADFLESITSIAYEVFYNFKNYNNVITGHLPFCPLFKKKGISDMFDKPGFKEIYLIVHDFIENLAIIPCFHFVSINLTR